MVDPDLINGHSSSEPFLPEFDAHNSSNIIDVPEIIKIARIIIKVNDYISPLFYRVAIIPIIIGTILNCLSTYCFAKMYKRSSQNIYLLVLSICDTINLHLNFTLPLLRQYDTFDSYFRHMNKICLFNDVLTEFFLIFPAWILVLLAIDRLIHILSPSKRHLSNSKRQAKISIIILILIVICLSLYRLFDVKGIDQFSVFAIVACNNGQDSSFALLRYINLMMWTIFPICFTLTISLIIIYQIKISTQKHNSNHSTAHCTLKCNQSTKITIFISILFPTFFDIPTAIITGLEIFYEYKKEPLYMIIMQVAKKLPMLLYEISLSCKFFVYIIVFQQFRKVLYLLFHRLARRRHSFELDRHSYVYVDNGFRRRTIRFRSNKQSITFSESHSNSYTRSVEQHQNNFNNRYQSTSISRIHQEYPSLAITVADSNEDLFMSSS
ncbi:unnamed protein product [Adineta steineri]|uniref:G-protein coupled receptors family 1 profile domain-containing protein n=1 Tax=Adineta steineri TaxID=433720 RepID=A0A813ZIC3_9BILA|nr:unnamed protein product [Adineta steineri]